MVSGWHWVGGRTEMEATTWEPKPHNGGNELRLRQKAQLTLAIC